MNDTAQAASTPALRDVKIGGVDLVVSIPYKAGDVLDADEAAQLNQVYIENIGNNFRKKVAEMLEGNKTPEDIQSELDKYADSYTFGSRRVGGVRRTTDPLEREMRMLAKKAVIAFFKKKDQDFAELSDEQKEQSIKTYLEKYGEQVKVIAQRRLDDAAALGEASLEG